ncbi:MAG: Rieske 2Fe-2S domain-containing protein [Rubrobacter sp.]|nr:Rieske 2Fe-2S domain-containing protein [Rubrobacter sp.]
MGDFVAYFAVCTHRGCTVRYQPQTQQLACPHATVRSLTRHAMQL